MFKWRRTSHESLLPAPSGVRRPSQQPLRAAEFLRTTGLQDGVYRILCVKAYASHSVHVDIENKLWRSVLPHTLGQPLQTCPEMDFQNKETG
ncbi:rCG42655, isoform CRA_a [Rattus norvegicus]|uniref:RCG42655, isoform CRA_a n=1 Tax=Rattus norvegicus TaxID=10116 RepID=A6K1E6_RAT|nr:rCG42655, isoform CRA_a [Rattus norvegicus]